MKKITFNAPLNHKAYSYEPMKIEVEKVIPLYGKRFEQMRDHPLEDAPEIIENRDLMYIVHPLDYRLTDQMLIGAILNVMNSVIANPSLLECNSESSSYIPSGEVIRQQNEIRHMMDAAQLDYDRTKSEILRLAQMQYDCCTYSDKPQQTELLRSLLVGHEQLNSLDIGLLRSCV